MPGHPPTAFKRHLALGRLTVLPSPTRLSGCRNIKQMVSPIEQVRRWLVAGVVVLVAAVGVAYWLSHFREKPELHNVPKQLGIDIQQSSEGFSLFKSEGGHTLYTIRASRAVQFKSGGRAELHNVEIVVYGKTRDRYDQIYGNQFTYDPQSGDIRAEGEVHIDLQGNTEGPLKPDQAPPEELKNPIHLTTRSISFNQKTGIARTDDLVEFRSRQATGSFKGAYYDSHTNQLTLNSEVHIVTTGEDAATITGAKGIIQKEPRQAVLEKLRIEQPKRTLTADKGTMLFEPDNTVKHAVVEGNVHIQDRGPSILDVTGPRGDLNMGPSNSVQQAILSGGARFETHGQAVSHGSAEKFVVDFEGQNQPARLHLIKDARMMQEPQPAKSGSAGQPMEIAAEQLDFQLANGNQLKTADTVGPGKITILPAPGGKAAGQSASGSNPTTIATAARFHATFGDNNHMQALHGSPDARIVSTSPGQPPKVSTSRNLDVSFASDGSVQKLVQSGSFQYEEPAAKPDTAGRQAFAEAATYTPADQILVLTGSPRVIDSGVTTTAEIVRVNRQTGDAWAEQDVKTTYSDLKPQPSGALLATSDPIHVTAHQMTAKQRPSVAHYSGDVRLWQGANVIRAPKIDFEEDRRSVTAQSDRGHLVSCLFVQEGQDGKVTPVEVTSEKLTYVDEQRRARYSGNVVAKTASGTITAQEIDIYLKSADEQKKIAPLADKRNSPASAAADAPSKIDHMVALGNVVMTEPNRRGVGDRLVYTADDGKYVLTGKSPSIFDAEHGTVWGDSLTFYSRDDRVLIESKRSSPTVTRARISK